ncbi:short-chain dehydrogenase/reductase SDR [Plesiocystis pacifica SIR-1]|uniref:Short-chain dehydrogenase/reductase SDR n=1 Tax=Plesiocystis pacifica SIR-1 TaxID=391625 RepID=A6GC41_9BACT|nr:SDR family NAD(P)-dependent oxidoreductase [Plesiocystis pacifica]EDM76603.1 short-chain dehydrogenase/reductase SDR [Plesiocystis pacifica SIR-1]
MKLDGLHVLITGGTAGIGLALAERLLREGARVSVCGRSEARAKAAAERLGPEAAAMTCDLSDPAQHPRLLADAAAANGPIDVLVNNAGVQQRMDFTDPQQRRAIADEVTINLTAPMLLTEALLPQLRGRPNAAIVQVTSGLALSPKASAPVYCATKAGLRAFTRTLRWQLADAAPGVRVVEVLPPLVDTAMTRGRGRGKLSPAAVAEAIVRGLRAERSEIHVGKSTLLRALVRLSPWLASLVTRRM